MPKRFAINVVLASFLSLSAAAQTSPFSDLKAAVAIDLAQPLALDQSPENTEVVRSVELTLYSPVDHLFDGTLTIAGHSEEGEFEFALHEGFLSTSSLIPRSRVRAGKFLLNIGRLNGFHQHDYSFITAPKVFREFFSPGSELMNAEGVMDSGIEYTWLTPASRFIEITIGAVNGACYGHCHESEGRPPRPTFYLRPTTFFEFTTERGFLLGATYLNRIDAFDATQLSGVDGTFKVRQGKILRWLIQGEAYYEHQIERDTQDFRERVGAYFLTEHGFDSGVSLGLRLDGFSHLNSKFEDTGESRSSIDYAFNPQLTYRFSEFSLARISYLHEVATLKGSPDVLERQVQLQLTIFMGAHPAHDF